MSDVKIFLRCKTNKKQKENIMKNTQNNVTKDGNIRTKKVCPFASRCSQKKVDCPTRGRTKPTQHKCGIARLFLAADARRATIKPETIELVKAIEPIETIETWSIADVVAQKRQERFAGETWIPQSVITAYNK